MSSGADGVRCCMAMVLGVIDVGGCCCCVVVCCCRCVANRGFCTIIGGCCGCVVAPPVFSPFFFSGSSAGDCGGDSMSVSSGCSVTLLFPLSCRVFFPVGLEDELDDPLFRPLSVPLCLLGDGDRRRVFSSALVFVPFLPFFFSSLFSSSSDSLFDVVTSSSVSLLSLTGCLRRLCFSVLPVSSTGE